MPPFLFRSMIMGKWAEQLPKEDDSGGGLVTETHLETAVSGPARLTGVVPTLDKEPWPTGIHFGPQHQTGTPVQTHSRIWWVCWDGPDTMIFRLW
ncbi:hypothetical protein NL676_031250 [Syzygium grande]|nr:hypothetical protein NL676_031250 [Syzygium grande]